MTSVTTLCPHCGFTVTAGRTICKSCGKSILEPTVTKPASLSTEPLSTEQRRAILQDELVKQATLGWRVVAQSDFTAQIEQETPINVLIALILLVLGLLPGILYILFGKGKRGMFLSIDEYGQITRRLTS